MCGIAGIIDFQGRPIACEPLERLCDSLAHRGPDDRGMWQFQSSGFSVGLAHTRLAVIDPTPEGHQPMLDAAGVRAICYNGELYNYAALRKELTGPWQTSCDTEVALQACAQWGPAAVERFDAMWAMAYVDGEARCGHLSRDPFGIKPLYYGVHDGRLAFASELAALRRVPGIPLDIDHEALAIYLTLGFIPHPLTIYRHIRKLPPGHRLLFAHDGPGEPERFHRLRASATTPPYADACREVRTRIEQAVLRQRVSDVPLGAFLSGGLDSSIVTACLARAGGPPVRTFSIGYTDHPRYDETEYAELVARHFGTRHRVFRLGFGDVVAAVEPVLGHLGEPFADSSLIPTSLVSRYTREHVTVALSGDGGDELFGGYWRYLGHDYLARYRRLPRVLRKGLIEPLLRLAPAARSTRWLDRIRQMRKLLRGDRADAMAAHLAWARILEPDLAAVLLGHEEAAGASQAIDQMYRTAPSRIADSELGTQHSSLNVILLADLAIGLPADMLFKVDTASMLHSLEVRVPLLSADVVDYVTALPIEYKIAGSDGKRILKDAFRDVLPPEIVARRKMGFEVPVGEFLRNELRGTFLDSVTPSSLDRFGIDTAAARRAFEEHRLRHQDHTELLWAMLVLSHWSHACG